MAPDFLETADRIARILCRDAVWAGSQCNWLGWDTEFEAGRVSPAWRAVGCDLYGGAAGIAFFLAQTWRFTRDAVELMTLKAALNRVLDALQAREGAVEPGFYSGAPGIAWVLIEAGKILENEDLIRRGLEELARTRQLSLHPGKIDVISGSAGIIPILLGMGERFRREDLFEIACLHGEHLLNLAHKSDNGFSWSTAQLASEKNLLGYSHGTAGIAVALLELHQFTGDQRYLHAGLETMRYERSHFSHEHRNWPDFRVKNYETEEDSPRFMTAWCHGAPGIGMSRLRIHELLEHDPSVREEIDVALQTTAEGLTSPPGFGPQSCCLCHGAFGNAELLLLASEKLDRPELRRLCEEAGSQGIVQYANNDLPWPCGTINSGETPGLLLGLAGIGYFYLRLHDSATVPSVLLCSSGARKR